MFEDFDSSRDTHASEESSVSGMGCARGALLTQPYYDEFTDQYFDVEKDDVIFSEEISYKKSNQLDGDDIHCVQETLHEDFQLDLSPLLHKKNESVVFQKNTTFKSNISANKDFNSDAQELFIDDDAKSYLSAQTKVYHVMIGNDAKSSSDSESRSIQDDVGGDDSLTEQSQERTPIQERRARNIRRHNAFAKSFDLSHHSKMTILSERVDNDMIAKRIQNVDYEHESIEEGTKIPAAAKKRTMNFDKLSFGKRPKVCLIEGEAPHKHPIEKSLSDVLELKYPFRRNEIKVLSSQLESVVQKTKLSSQITHSRTQSHYSEASYHADVHFSSPAPIIISGAGGTGKTCIVRDVVHMLRERYNHNYEVDKCEKKSQSKNIVSEAYIDCASAEFGTLTSVLSSAFRQLYDCYCSGNDLSLKCIREKTSDEVAFIKHNEFQENRFLNMAAAIGNIDQVYVDDDEHVQSLDIEEFIERQRKHHCLNHVKKRSYRSSLDKEKPHDISFKNRSTKFHREARQNPPDSSSITKSNTFHRSFQYSNDSTSIALFGRAVSMLLHGKLSRKRLPVYGRCAILVLDNAERILSWKKSGSLNALTQLFMLPSATRLNLTLIIISRNSLLPFIRLTFRKSTGTLIDAYHPVSIYFKSYTCVQSLKKILCTPRMQHLITGRIRSLYDTSHCILFNRIMHQFNDIVYRSMLNSFLPSVESLTYDVTEIVRLARLLWPYYISPLHEQKKHHELHKIVAQVILSLRREMMISIQKCNQAKCACCQSADLVCLESEKTHFSNDWMMKMFTILDHNNRGISHRLLAFATMMPGKAIRIKQDKMFVLKLPYTTKFLLLAAFLCQQKRADQDINNFTKNNSGKRSKREMNTADEGTSYSLSLSNLNLLRASKMPCFSVERLLSVFSSIFEQYGKNEKIPNFSHLGTESIFKSITQLSAAGLMCRSSIDNIELKSEKFTCGLSREDANVIASSVAFPLEKYCP